MVGKLGFMELNMTGHIYTLGGGFKTSITFGKGFIANKDARF